MINSKNYKEIVSEALNDISRVGNNDEVRSGTGKTLVALVMVIGDLNESSKKISNHIDTLNGKIEKYSQSSDNYAKAMKWLTGALVFVGFIQVIIAFIK